MCASWWRGFFSHWLLWDLYWIMIIYNQFKSHNLETLFHFGGLCWIFFPYLCTVYGDCLIIIFKKIAHTLFHYCHVYFVSRYFLCAAVISFIHLAWNLFSFHLNKWAENHIETQLWTGPHTNIVLLVVVQLMKCNEWNVIHYIPREWVFFIVFYAYYL